MAEPELGTFPGAIYDAHGRNLDGDIPDLRRAQAVAPISFPVILGLPS